jgi:hypothetical protein
MYISFSFYSPYPLVLSFLDELSSKLCEWVSELGRKCECIAICSCWSLLKSCCYDFVHFHDFQMMNKFFLEHCLLVPARKQTELELDLLFWGWETLTLKMRQTDSTLRLVIFRQSQRKENAHPANLECCDVSLDSTSLNILGHVRKLWWYTHMGWRYSGNSQITPTCRSFYLGRRWLIIKRDTWILKESIMLF